MFELWMVLVLGLVLIFGSALSIVTGISVFRGFPISSWVEWPILFIGLFCFAISIRAFIRNTGKEYVRDFDEDVQKAEAEMDAMYVRDHGTLPEKPWKVKDDN